MAPCAGEKKRFSCAMARCAEEERRFSCAMARCAGEERRFSCAMARCAGEERRFPCAMTRCTGEERRFPCAMTRCTGEERRFSWAMTRCTGEERLFSWAMTRCTGEERRFTRATRRFARATGSGEAAQPRLPRTCPTAWLKTVGMIRDATSLKPWRLRASRASDRPIPGVGTNVPSLGARDDTNPPHSPYSRIFVLSVVREIPSRRLASLWLPPACSRAVAMSRRSYSSCAARRLLGAESSASGMGGGGSGTSGRRLALGMAAPTRGSLNVPAATLQLRTRYRRAWEELLAVVRVRQLSESELIQARQKLLPGAPDLLVARRSRLGR